MAAHSRELVIDRYLVWPFYRLSSKSMEVQRVPNQGSYEFIVHPDALQYQPQTIGRPELRPSFLVNRVCTLRKVPHPVHTCGLCPFGVHNIVHMAYPALVTIQILFYRHAVLLPYAVVSGR